MPGPAKSSYLLTDYWGKFGVGKVRSWNAGPILLLSCARSSMV